MVIKRLVMLGALPVFAVSAMAGSYVNQIIQKQVNQLGEEVTYSVPNVGDSGSMAAPLPILFGESAFELWSVNGDTSESKLLDTTVVNGYYNPSFEILTLDPNDTTANPRTRVDKAYSVQIIGVSSVYHAAAAQQLAMLSNIDMYSGGKFGFPPEYKPDYSSASDVSSVISSMLSSSITVTSNISTGGQETYSLWEPAADGGASTLLNAQSIEIWPDVTVEFKPGSELVGGETYRQFEELIIDINNLYAVDSWAVRVRDSSGVITLVRSGPVSGDAPTNVPVPVDNLADFLSGAGAYTLEVVNQAEGLDASPELRLSVPFTYDPRIIVNSVIGSSE